MAPTSAPVQPIQPAPPEGPPPGYTAQPAGAYPGSPGPGLSAGSRQQPGGALVAAACAAAAESSGPVYTKWWFWTIVGVVVVGGVVTAVALSGGTSKPPCPATAVICECQGSPTPAVSRGASGIAVATSLLAFASLGGCQSKDSLILVTVSAGRTATRPAFVRWW